MKDLCVLVVMVALMNSQPLPERKDTYAGRAIDERGKQEFLEYCKTHECRRDTHFKLKKKDGSYFEFNSEMYPPVVQPKFISILPGEKLLIEADIEGDRLTDLRSVKTVQHPEKTIKLSFRQEPTVGDGTGMILKVENPFGKFLRYRLDMMPLGSDSLHYTSSCPVIPEKMAYEQWPYPIFQLIISDLRFVEGEETTICK